MPDTLPPPAAVLRHRRCGRYGTVSEETRRRVEDALKVATGLTKM